jgi:hypothetical protein
MAECDGWYETPATIPAETVWLSLPVPASREIIGLVLGSLQSDLCNYENYIEFGVSAGDLIARLGDMFRLYQISEDEPAMPTIYPRRAELNPMLSLWSLSVGTLSAFQHPFPYGMWTLQSSASIGDSLKSRFNLAAGTYVLEMWYSRSTANGMIDIYVDGVAVVQGEDLYQGIAAGVRKLYTVEVLEDGNHLLQVVCTGKHASSTGYQMRLGSFTFRNE